MANKKKKSSEIHKSNSEIRGIIIIGISIILLLSLYTDTVGYLSVISKKIFVTLIGIGAFLVPIFAIYLAIKLHFGSKSLDVTKKHIGIGLAIINTILLIQTLKMSDMYIEGEVIKSIVMIAASHSYLHGGVVGFLIVLPLYKFLGAVGLYIILVLIYLISSVLIYNYNFHSVLSSIKSSKDKIKKDNDKTLYEKDGFINIKGQEDEKEDFMNKIDNKIKILDFMKTPNKDKNKEYQNTLTEDVISVMEQDADETYKKRENKSHEKLGNDIKESVGKEITDKIINNGNNPEYIVPSAELLKINTNLKLNKEDKKDLLANANKLEDTLGSFGVEAKILQVTKGPSVTRYELQPKAGVKVSKIVNLSDDIALGLAASAVRIEAPIPGKSAIGIEIPNKEQTPVFFREILESEEFKNNNSKVACALGKDITGKCIVTDLTKMPHILIAGATGSGKSVCINTLIISILYKYSPDDVKLLMVDPKVVELNVYNGIPHLLIPVVTEPKKAAAALHWAVNEMTRRYNLFAENGVRNVESYNALANKGIVKEKLPYVVIIVDELSDLMMICPNDVEDYICRLAQMARAAGMHLVIATQRPSVDVITGLIKANIPSRISFAVSSQVDSRTILDSSGAEKLLGRGDMLFYPVGEAKPLRVQGAFISEEEVEQVVSFIKDTQVENLYEEEILEHINSSGNETNQIGDEKDELLEEAIKIVVDSGQVSTSYLQRRLRIGFNRAARIMEQLEENNIISKREGNKPRQILITREELENMY